MIVILLCRTNKMAKAHNSAVTHGGMLQAIVRVSDGTTCHQEPLSLAFVQAWSSELEMLKWLAFHDQPKHVASNSYHALGAARSAVLAFMGRK